MKKILVITPLYPFIMKGACDQDRAEGVRILKKLGYDVSVITMVYKSHLPLVSQAEKDFDITITPILLTQKRYTRTQSILKTVQRIFIPLYWDGAAHEYRDALTQKTVSDEIERYTPDLVWFDYSYLWPLYHLVKSKNIPIITRSINYEPAHFLGKVTKTIPNLLKYMIKRLGEKRMLALSNVVFPITTKEKLIYEQFGKTTLATIPLRRLSKLIGKNTIIHKRKMLNVFFMGSTYAVHHMTQALKFILDEINPLLQEKYPDTFTLHILGAKIPSDIAEKTYKNVLIHGYIKDLDTLLLDMDIALAPSLSGEGMQQKVFEPIVRGIPTITSERALAGYPFYNGIHLLTAEEHPQSFISALGTLISDTERSRISQNAIQMAETVFSEELISSVIDWHIKKLIK